MAKLPGKSECILTEIKGHITALVKGHKCEVICKLPYASKPEKIKGAQELWYMDGVLTLESRS